MRIQYSFQGQDRIQDFDADQIIIGRPRLGVSVDLDLTPDQAVSRPHARLWLQDGQFWIEDLSSKYGVWLDGRLIEEPQSIVPGNVIKLGHTLLRLRTGKESSSRNLSTLAFGSLGTIADSDVEIGYSLDARRGMPEFIVADDASAETRRRLALVYELPLQFAVETQLDALLQTIVKRLVEVIPDAARCTLLLQDRHCGELQPAASFPASAGVSKTLARRAIDERNGFIWRRAEEGDISQSVVFYGIETGMYAPLLWQDRAIGAVCVDNPRRTSIFSDDDLQLMLMVAQYAAMAVANQQLQQELREAWTGSLDALAAALASRDNETQSHCFRTVELAVELARQMELPEREIAAIARGALLHDIGKIGISDQILFKPASLTVEERDTMKQHVRLGYDMLHHIGFFNDALPVVLYHHEEYDGSGYPEGLAGEAIPLAARIFHAVDAYDALTQARPYKSAWTHDVTLMELRRLSGIRYDPVVVAALERLRPEVTARIRSLSTFSPAIRDLLGRGIQ